MMKEMFKLLLCIIAFIFSAASSEDIMEKVDLLEQGTYIWNGLNKESTSVNVTAERFCILVTIDTCDIGRDVEDVTPNEEYLILREGDVRGTSTEVGRRFAYIKTAKQLYFYSSSVILELKAPEALTKPCTVTFKKADEQETTLPPVTTPRPTPSVGPHTSTYSTVYISGKKIDDFNNDKNLVLKLKEMLTNMAVEYTKVEGFCSLKEITTDNVDVHVLEQCPIKWPNYETCVRLVYAIPVEMKEKCTLWKGYQITEEHLDIMWTRMSEKYLTDGFQTYTVPSVDNVVTWWMACTFIVIIAFSVLMIAVNMIWKRRQISRRKIPNDIDDFTDIVRVTNENMSPTDYQGLPPMFEAKHSNAENYFEEKHGNDNKGFQRNDEIHPYEDD